MKFFCLVCAERVMETMPPADADRHYADYHEFTNELRASGHLLDCNRLLPPDMATTVRVRQGRVTTMDGPFTETKVIGGYYVIEAVDQAEAVSIARRSRSRRLDRLCRSATDRRG